MSRVAVIAGQRTPFVKALTVFKDVPALDLATHAVNGLLSHTSVDPQSIPELQLGLVVVEPRIPHMAREVVFKSDLTSATRAVTVTDNCITGTSALLGMHDAIALGRIDAWHCGGGGVDVEHADHGLAAARGRPARQLVPRAPCARRSGRSSKCDLATSSPVCRGSRSPAPALSMGEHTELMVKEWGSRATCRTRSPTGPT